MMSPWYSSGVVFSTFMIGSSRIGLAFLKASFKAKIAAILNASSFESTSWKRAVDDVDFDVDDLVAGDDAVRDRFFDAIYDRPGCIPSELCRRRSCFRSSMPLPRSFGLDVDDRRDRIDRDRRTAG